MFYRLAVVLLCTYLLFATACSRQRYRLRADRDVDRILHEQTAGSPWSARAFSVELAPDSQLADPTPLDDPCLPIPAPSLYAYELPESQPRDPSRFTGSVQNASSQPILQGVERLGTRSLRRLPSDAETAEQIEPQEVNETIAPVVPLGYEELEPSVAVQNPVVADGVSDAARETTVTTNSLGERRIVPIVQDAWESIPASCLMRCLEFTSVRQEYVRTFGREPGEGLDDSAQQLTLEDLLEIALRNSREYQTQKEQLYRAALALSQERYAYQLKFSPFGNGIDANWSHRNDLGVTENALAAGSGAALEQVLTTGGTLLARFANDVVLTFNGASGFSTDIGSELLAELTQPLLQRDIVFERLTQTERNVVYAARDYARFRKRFFRDIAGAYYELLLTYRRIEIDMLDFFSNQRGFDQAKAEYRLLQKIPRFQVDQFEQNALSSRSRVIRSCNDLEQRLDELKLSLGIPPETPINLDLTELELLTARDEITVAAELASRAYRNLQAEVENSASAATQLVDRVLVVNAAIQLAQKLSSLLELQTSIADNDIDSSRFQAATSLLNKLLVEAAAIKVEEDRSHLLSETNSPRPPLPVDLLNSRNNLIDSLIELGRLQRIAYGQGATEEELLEFLRRRNQLSNEFDAIDSRLSENDKLQLSNEETLERMNRELARLPGISDRAGQLLAEVEQAVGIDEKLDASTLVRDVLLLGDKLRHVDVGGLAPIDLPVDEAMLTALVTRFDLMNERGILADTWRQIKLAGDDLRSILNLRASQSVRTTANVNRPFEFTFDESQTQFGVTFDAPLNRRVQRNNYRLSLIDYSLALRNLRQLEDEIKFTMRNDLRNLQLDREQYSIAVASAALASDRRLSTRKQLDLGQENITARDFLEAQQAYTASLNDVAGAHIGYVLNRIDLFLDMELLQVDDSGFWPQLYDESLQPEPRAQPPQGAGPAYGRLPSRVRYSKRIRRMDHHPFGWPAIMKPGPGGEPSTNTVVEDLPEPSAP